MKAQTRIEELETQIGVATVQAKVAMNSAAEKESEQAKTHGLEEAFQVNDKIKKELAEVKKALAVACGDRDKAQDECSLLRVELSGAKNIIWSLETAIVCVVEKMSIFIAKQRDLQQ